MENACGRWSLLNCLRGLFKSFCWDCFSTEKKRSHQWCRDPCQSMPIGKYRTHKWHLSSTSTAQNAPSLYQDGRLNSKWTCDYSKKKSSQSQEGSCLRGIMIPAFMWPGHMVTHCECRTKAAWISTSANNTRSSSKTIHEPAAMYVSFVNSEIAMWKAHTQFVAWLCCRIGQTKT